MRETLESLCQYANTGSKVVSLPHSSFEFLMNVASKLKLSPLGSLSFFDVWQEPFF